MGDDLVQLSPPTVWTCPTSGSWLAVPTASSAESCPCFPHFPKSTTPQCAQRSSLQGSGLGWFCWLDGIVGQQLPTRKMTTLRSSQSQEDPQSRAQGGEGAATRRWRTAKWKATQGTKAVSGPGTNSPCHTTHSAHTASPHKGEPWAEALQHAHLPQFTFSYKGICVHQKTNIPASHALVETKHINNMSGVGRAGEGIAHKRRMAQMQLKLACQLQMARTPKHCPRRVLDQLLPSHHQGWQTCLLAAAKHPGRKGLEKLGF